MTAIPRADGSVLKRTRAALTKLGLPGALYTRPELSTTVTAAATWAAGAVLMMAAVVWTLADSTSPEDHGWDLYVSGGRVDAALRTILVLLAGWLLTVLGRAVLTFVAARSRRRYALQRRREVEFRRSVERNLAAGRWPAGPEV